MHDPGLDVGDSAAYAEAVPTAPGEGCAVALSSASQAGIDQAAAAFEARHAALAGLYRVQISPAPGVMSAQQGVLSLAIRNFWNNRI